MVSSAASDAFIARFDMSMTYKNLHAQNPESGIQTDWNEFNLWPNPSNGLLEISTEKDNVIDEVMIYDATGRSVYSGKSAQNNVVVNLPELPTGPYYVSILTNGKTLHKKLIIVK